jgi:DNA topoisomerase IB
VSETVRAVAAHLGNTPAVCRASFIVPRVFDRFREGATLEMSLTAMPEDDDDARATIEAAVLDLLEGAPGRALAA